MLIANSPHVRNLMRSPFAQFCVALFLSCASSCRLPAQVMPLRLGKPILTSEAYFTDVSSAIRWNSGDVVVADPGGRELALVSGINGAIRPVAREGEGPGEYRVPQMVFQQSEGEFALFDSRLLRVVIYSSSGKFIRSQSTGALGGAVVPLSSSGDGRIIFRGFSGSGSDHDAPIVSLRPSTGGVDTITRISGPVFVDLGGADAGKVGGRILRILPYSNVDGFAALSDGTFVVARSARNTVEWYDQKGKLFEAVRFPRARIPMSDSIRELVRPLKMRAMLPSSLPAFDDFGIVRSSNDRVWIRAMQRESGSSIWYGFKRGERAIQSLSLPKGSRLIGMQEPYVIVVNRADADLQAIQIFSVQP